MLITAMRTFRLPLFPGASGVRGLMGWGLFMGEY
jgi:hypothetical protein